MKQWKIQSKITPNSYTALRTVLLDIRGIKDIKHFLEPQDPMQLLPVDVDIDDQAVKRAVDRLILAKRTREKIIVFGDYDCDGVCATTILWETLYEGGWNALPFLPSRTKHGYGLSVKVLEEILADGKPDILISVDNGIVAHKAWEKLKKEGVYTILTDHHEPDKTLPKVDCLIHTTKLCGSTVAWMLARALDPVHAKAMLDLCAVAAVADQVPLEGANRDFTVFGLAALNSTTRVGLRLLIEKSDMKLGELTTESINYGIAPRINAMGRLGDARDALRALCTKKMVNAEKYVDQLHLVNGNRQELTSRLMELALGLAKDQAKEHIIIVSHADFHEGVIGLIASRLTEEFYKPSLVFSQGELASKASGRSVPGVHLTKLLRKLRRDLLEVGGHPMAAGVKVETKNLQSFSTHLFALARKSIKPNLLVPMVKIDCALPIELLTLETAQFVAGFAPFGAGNPTPVFAFPPLKVLTVSTMGKDAKHLKIKLQLGSDVIEAVGFGMASRAPKIHSGQMLTVAGKLEVNTWRDVSRMQINLVDLA